MCFLTVPFTHSSCPFTLWFHQRPRVSACSCFPLFFLIPCPCCPHFPLRARTLRCVRARTSTFPSFSFVVLVALLCVPIFCRRHQTAAENLWVVSEVRKTMFLLFCLFSGLLSFFFCLSLPSRARHPTLLNARVLLRTLRHTYPYEAHQMPAAMATTTTAVAYTTNMGDSLRYVEIPTKHLACPV